MASSTTVRDVDGQRGVEHAKRVGMMVAPDVKVSIKLLYTLLEVGANKCSVDPKRREDFDAAQGSATKA